VIAVVDEEPVGFVQDSLAGVLGAGGSWTHD
jgi:hypothetical protein